MYLPPLEGFRRAKGGGDSRLVLLMAFAWVFSLGSLFPLPCAFPRP